MVKHLFVEHSLSEKTMKVFVEDQWEDWQDLSGRMLWRRSHPSYLNITVFARNHQTERPMSAQPDTAPEPVRVDQSPVPEGPTAASPVENLQPGQMPTTSPASHTPIESPNSQTQVAPSQIDEFSNYHGPKFLSMSSEDRKLALRLHKNLGHPDPQRLSQVLRQQGY